jgi:hypothetical protein
VGNVGQKGKVYKYNTMTKLSSEYNNNHNNNTGKSPGEIIIVGN